MIEGPWDVFVRRLAAGQQGPFPISSEIEAAAAIRAALGVARRSELGTVTAEDHHAGHYLVDRLPESVVRRDGSEFRREVAGYQVTIPMPNDEGATP